jgi:hypothetical protein
VIRFALGGAATVFAGLVSSHYGASVGGLFLALPAIFCASATLIEKHEIRRKREAGLAGERRGEEAAALDAAGAALGALGMLAFAGVFWLRVECSAAGAFAAASLAWLCVSPFRMPCRRGGDRSSTKGGLGAGCRAGRRPCADRSCRPSIGYCRSHGRRPATLLGRQVVFACPSRLWSLRSHRG